MDNKDVIMKEEFTEEELKTFSKIPEAAFANLTHMMDRINNMNETELVEKLKCFHLEPKGDVENLRKTLKDSYKKISLASTDLSLSSELLPYYVVIDFEATCQEVNPPNFRHEIIEFPAVLVHSKSQEIIDSFQMYCKPEINPKISKFCTELTGITQEQVDSAEPFEKVLEHFQKWLLKHELGKRYKYVVVTDGPLDIIRFLFSQCHYSNIRFPKWATKWVNLRKTFRKFYQCERMCLKNMLEFLDMDFVGRPHCGLDDSRNIARILLRMIYDGANIQTNERLASSKPKMFKPREDCENKEMTKESCPNGERTEKTEKQRVEAHYSTIYYTDKMPVYKKSRRDRLIAEAHLARKILTDHNCTQSTNQRASYTKRKKKIKKES